MLYQICNGGVKFAADTILEHINFEIRNTEKIAVVGRNGCGKTTLLRLIAGEVDLEKRDSDEDIFISPISQLLYGLYESIKALCTNFKFINLYYLPLEILVCLIPLMNLMIVDYVVLERLPNWIWLTMIYVIIGSAIGIVVCAI
jgi:energy-coupling factor transporter ATP-binding protein EcfA2